MNYFSKNYEEARDKFLGSAKLVEAEIRSYSHPLTGPLGERLATDVAWIGPRTARNVLVLLSGVHGVEGFFGSAVQTGWLQRSEYLKLPADSAVLLIHAINPYGFAWLRRTNEDNVDLNRNWVDFSRRLPSNDRYCEIADDLAPKEWTDESRLATGDKLVEWTRTYGMGAYLQAVTGGQWSHPKGIFYGGTKESWSRRTLTEIVMANLTFAKRVVMIDFHTGLGAHGYAEPIIHRRTDDPGFARTRAWIGAAAKSIYGGGSISAEVHGDGLSAIQALLSSAKVDAISLECGVQSIDRVGLALRADNWLHAYGDPKGRGADQIKSLIRSAFHSDDLLWQGMAIGQGLAACKSAIGALYEV